LSIDLLNWKQKFLAILVASIFICAPSPAALSDAAWLQLQRSGTDALDANKYWLAEPLLKQAVSEAELFGFNDLRLAKSLSELGRLYTIRGRFQVAQPFLEREFAVREVAYGKDDGRMIQPMGSLINFYLNYGTASKADVLTEDLLAFVEGKIAESHFQNEAKATRKEGAPLIGYAGTAAPAMRDPLIEWAITCDSIANMYRSRKNYEMAERLYKDALDIKATVLGKGHLSLANSYDSLGSLALEKGELKEAESYFRDAYTTTGNTLSTESPELYGRLDKLAKCLIKEGKMQEAEELYLLALTTFWQKTASKTGDESRCLYALGSLYSAQKNYAKAAPMFSRSLRMAERFSGPYSVSLVPYLEQYAYALYHLGRRSETNALRARARAIAGPPDKPESAEKPSAAKTTSGKPKLKSSAKKKPGKKFRRSSGRRRH